MMSVDSFQSGVEQGMSGRSLEVESIKEMEIEIDMCDKVTIAEPGVELESKKNKEGGERELEKLTMFGLGVGDSFAKADKFVERKVITASLGRIV